MHSMKFRTIYVFSLMAICAFGFAARGQSKPAIPKFDGTWVLNRAKSSGLTGALGNAEIRLLVSQDSKELTVEQKLVIRGREQDSPLMV